MALSTTPDGLRELVRPDRVHRDVYLDRDVFREEIRRIHGRAWLYVGHDSQVRNPGDYVTTVMGLTPVVVVRHKDGSIRVLRNRCGHKGAEVVGKRCGSAKSFRCMYHGWTYDTDGSLQAVPQRKGYDGTGIDLSNPAHGMTPAPRVGIYRGFIFASFAGEGPELETFLGPTTTALDNIADRAPDGEVEVVGGPFRLIQRNNWKMIIENLNDLMHPMVAHISSTEAAAQEEAALPEGLKPPAEIPLLTSNGWSYDFWNGLRVVCCEYGHSLMGAINTPRDTDPVFVEYADVLARRHGAHRADEVLSYPSVMALVYPNISLHTSYQQLRVIHPVDVDRTLLEVWTFRLKGAPEGMYQRARTYANLVNSPSSIGNADDVEAFMRVHRGLGNDTMEWISQHRNAGQDEQTNEGLVAVPGTSELPMRNHFKAWLGYMTGELDDDR
jgi:phenylpropionate dioxygenase-like ring-hydroxylating dioxygenase large terminal subunit